MVNPIWGDAFMSKPKAICDTCIFFAPQEGGLTVINRGDRIQKSFGQCRRHSPVLKPVLKQKWPEIFGDDWCGDHKHDSQ